LGVFVHDAFYFTCAENAAWAIPLATFEFPGALGVHVNVDARHLKHLRRRIVL